MDKQAFGKQLQLYRERAGYSQEALAEQIGERGLGSNALVPGIAPGLMAQVQAPYRVFYHIGYHFTGS